MKMCITSMDVFAQSLILLLVSQTFFDFVVAKVSSFYDLFSKILIYVSLKTRFRLIN